MSNGKGDNKLLKGNFNPAKDVLAPQGESTLEDQFEREALKRLGGSVAFVARRKVVWDINTEIPEENGKNSKK